MVSKGLLACIASGAIASNSLAVNVGDIQHKTPVIENVNNARDRSYDYEKTGYMMGTLLGAIGLIGAISLANKYLPKLIDRNSENAVGLIATEHRYEFHSKPIKINLGDGHFHG